MPKLVSTRICKAHLLFTRGPRYSSVLQLGATSNSLVISPPPPRTRLPPGPRGGAPSDPKIAKSTSPPEPPSVLARSPPGLRSRSAKPGLDPRRGRSAPSRAFQHQSSPAASAAPAARHSPQSPGEWRRTVNPSEKKEKTQLRKQLKKHKHITQPANVQLSAKHLYTHAEGS